MKRWLIARRIVQAGAIVLFSMPIIITGWNLLGLPVSAEATDFRIPTPAQQFVFGSLSSSEVLGIRLSDPYAFLQSTLATRQLNITWLWTVLPIFAFYVTIGSRIFCGWVCPVNPVLELVNWLRKKLNIPNAGYKLPRKTKIAVMVFFLLVSFAVSRPLFEAISPIAAVGKTILYGSFAGTGTLLGIIILELFWAPRIWCRSLCPLGGFYQVFGRIGIFRPHIKHNLCVSCGECKEVCLVDPQILEPATQRMSTKVRAGDCMRCGSCIDVCPSKCLKMRVF